MTRTALWMTTLMLVLSACNQSNPSAPTPVDPAKKEEAKMGAEPDHITVQHVLIAFSGTGTRATRSKEEAKVLADNVLSWAKGGMAMDELMKKYSDDTGGGTYKMSNKGIPKRPGGYERTGMVPAFGNVGFVLEVGAIGMAAFDARTSPYGWHIIKRLT